MPLALLLQLQKSKSNLDMDLGEFWELVMDREAWRATVHGVAKSRTRLSDWTELNWNKIYLKIPMRQLQKEI